MPFGAPSLAQPVINSVAGGAPGATLQKKVTKERCDAFPLQESFKNIKSFIEACAMSAEGKELPQAPEPAAATTASSSAASATELLRDTPLKPLLASVTDTLFPTLHGFVDSIPLHDMKAQRFGNKAFRDFCQKISDELLNGFIKTSFMPVLEAMKKKSNDSAAPIPPAVANEMYEYLLDSFGNAQRIDYGTGHELHFLCFLYVAVVSSVGVPQPSDAATDNASVASSVENGLKEGLADLVLVVFPQYLAFCRRLQQHYSLEPAGSHGVWGLDDYHHLPFLFGASQLVGSEPNILPKHISEKHLVEKLRKKYLYFEMIGWIGDNKKGPFHEHSPILYNVSGIEEWARIRQGMLKMYVAEVMGRFAVVQHFLFGPTLPWKENGEVEQPVSL